jgi:hypothetical protein
MFFDLKNGDGIVIDNVVAAGTGNNPTGQGKGLFALKGGLNNPTIKNVHITGAGRFVLNLWVSPSDTACTNVLLDNWYVVTTADQVMDGSNKPIERDVMWFNSVDGITIQNSYFEMAWITKADSWCGGTCQHYDIVQFAAGYNGLKPTNLTIRNNMFVTSGTSGNRVVSSDQSGQAIIFTNPSGYQDIYGNIFAHTGTANGFALLWLQPVGTFRFYNNTIVEKQTNDTDAYNALLNMEGSPVGTNIFLKNNIIYSAYSGLQIMLRKTGSGTVTHDYNIYYGGGSTAFLGTSCSSYASANESCSTDPLFLDYGNNDYRISTTSPAYNNGTDLGSGYSTGLSTSSASFPNPATITRPWPSGGAWDISAYEYSVAGDETPPDIVNKSPAPDVTGWLVTDRGVSFDVTDDTGVDSSTLTFNIDGATNQTCSSGLTCTPAGDPTSLNVVYNRGADWNYEQTYTANVAVDDTDRPCWVSIPRPRDRRGGSSPID